MLGVYVPLTMEGNVVVDGVLASCYTVFDHDFAHLTMAPMQRFSEAMEWIFGNNNGYSVFVSTVKELGILVMPKIK